CSLGSRLWKGLGLEDPSRTWKPSRYPGASQPTEKPTPYGKTTQSQSNLLWLANCSIPSSVSSLYGGSGKTGYCKSVSIRPWIPCKKVQSGIPILAPNRPAAYTLRRVPGPTCALPWASGSGRVRCDSCYL